MLKAILGAYREDLLFAKERIIRIAETFRYQLEQFGSNARVKKRAGKR